ncbi:hypothetical protein [Clostridium sp.]|uniref:hypothetical protein n=1 Tax=Clostridium sp. TaxID=1506 RepID=UPI003F3B3D56
MSKINATPEAIREFAAEIKNFIEGQREVIGRLNNCYRNLGNDWNDPQYQKFGECLEMVTRGVGSVMPTCEETIRHLERKASILDEYND